MVISYIIKTRFITIIDNYSGIVDTSVNYPYINKIILVFIILNTKWSKDY